jgi:hypothetical protein
MEGLLDYQAQLDAALEKRRLWLESIQIPKLKESLGAFEALFEGAVALLIRKGLLREDPYNYEQAITDITIPKDETLPDFENTDEVSYRLAAYRRQLKFVSAEYPLDIESLGLARVKKLSALISYINWLELGEASKSPTTRAFARAFMKVRMSQDTMASQILKDSEIQLVRNTHAIRALLADLIAWYRESWKAEIRRIMISTAAPAAAPAAGQPNMKKEEMLKAMRRGFPPRTAGKPWYPSLADELVEDELAPDSAERKQKILASLAIAEPEKAQAAAPQDGRSILMEAVRLLSRPHEDLATAAAVLGENEKLLIDARGASGGWLRRIFGGGSGASTGDRTYKVQYAEPGVQAPKTEVIDFNAFSEDVSKKAGLLETLASAAGPAQKKLASTGEEQLAAFVDKQLNDILLIHRRLGCLNTMFQARLTQEKKTARGIKIELLTIKNSIVKANQKRHEYAGGPGA